jgi:hypothetical protein
VGAHRAIVGGEWWEGCASVRTTPVEEEGVSGTKFKRVVESLTSCCRQQLLLMRFLDGEVFSWI